MAKSIKCHHCGELLPRSEVKFVGNRMFHDKCVDPWKQKTQEQGRYMKKKMDDLREKIKNSKSEEE